MPSRAGSLVHQVIGDHESEDIGQLLNALNDQAFILIDEIYKDNDAGRYGNLYTTGKMILNSTMIGKIKEYNP
jgi:hypothetical protein